jgi:hypothetical protein
LSHVVNEKRRNGRMSGVVGIEEILHLCGTVLLLMPSRATAASTSTSQDMAAYNYFPSAGSGDRLGLPRFFIVHDR